MAQGQEIFAESTEPLRAPLDINVRNAIEEEIMNGRTVEDIIEEHGLEVAGAYFSNPYLIEEAERNNAA